MDNTAENIDIGDYDESFFSFYRSLDISKREEDQFIVKSSIENNVVPHVLRYSIVKGTKRGVIRDGEGNDYYFTLNKKFKLVKADTEEKSLEVSRLMKNCLFGVDIIKADSKKEDKEEENKEKEEKAIGAPSSGMLPVTEEQNIGAQQRLTTEEHPGAEGASTPDNNEAKWHPDVQQSTTKKAIDNLSFITKSLSSNYFSERVPTDQEQQFMIMVLGRTPEEARRQSLTPQQKVAFQQWLGKSLDSKLNTLKKWIG